MKFKNIRTFESLLKEYGAKPGSSTPVSDQQSLSTAKTTASTKSVKSPTTQASTPKPDLGSPTTTPGLKIGKDDEEQTPRFINAKAGELKKDMEYFDKDGKNVGVVKSPIGKGTKPEAVVVQDPKTKKYSVIDDPDEEVFVANPEFTEGKLDKLSKSSSSNFHFKKNRLHKKIKKLTRQIKLREQGPEVICEINFNSKEVAQSALNSGIKCGFEAETVWPNLGEGGDPDDTDWLDNLYWNRVSDLIYDQEGARSLERVEEAYREWLQDYVVTDIESDVVQELVDERKEDEAYIDDFVNDQVDMDEVEEYKAEKLERLEIDDMQDELEEYSDWDIDAWAREYVEMEKEDELVEWLEEQIRNNGEAWDEAWERAQNDYDMDDWVRREHSGSWYSLLSDLDIYLNNEDAEGGGVEEVASMLEDWASNNSRSSDVRAGGYHSGKGVDNTYWRVEEDSSIEGSGAKAEIISPVYDSPAEMLREMKSLFEYMSSNDVETNSSTGLHVTMSMPESGTAETNQLKMALLLGDKYVAKQYGRERNSYTSSQMARIKDYVADLQNNIKNEKSLAALEELVSGGISRGKFSSINFKDAENDAGNKLIEFRVAGGEDYHTMMDTVVKTVIRYGAVMQAGHDPAAFRKDYVKALVKLVTNKGDIDQTTQQKAQQLVDPESIDSNVLSAFQTIAGKKHYTDAIEALSDAYMRLADVQKMRAANPQKELQLEDDENADWRRQMKYAQNYFVRAFAMLASDVASGVNRAQPKSAQIAALRRATSQFGLTPAELWERLQQSEFYKNFPGDVHSKSEKFASAVNSLLKKQEAKGLEPKFTVKFNPATQRMFMPGPIVGAAYRDSGNNIFGDDGKATGNMPQTLGPEHFKAMDDSEYDRIREIRYHYDNKLQGIESDMEVINATKQRQKELPAQASEFQPMIDDRMERVKKDQAEAADYKKELDQFAKKYGFVPRTVRHGSEPLGEDWQVVSTDVLAWISQQYNIKFAANESVFAKFDALPLQEQLRILSKVDKRKLDEAWSKKKNEGWGDDDKRQFKRNELQHELGHEKNNYTVIIDGKPWKTVSSKDRARKMVQTLVRKGKNAKYAETGLPISETIEAEQDMAALLTAYGTPKKTKKVKTETANSFNRVEVINNILADKFPVNDLKKQMKAYEAIPKPQMLDAFRDLRGSQGDHADARSIVRFFVRELPADMQEKLNLREWSKQRVKQLAEAAATTLSAPKLIKDPGRMQNLLNNIRAKSPLYLVDGTPIIIDPAEADRIEDLWKNDLFKGSLQLKTDTGTTYPLSAFLKTSDYGGQAIPPGQESVSDISKEAAGLKPSDIGLEDKKIPAAKVSSVIQTNPALAQTDHGKAVIEMSKQISRGENVSIPTGFSKGVVTAFNDYAGEYLGVQALIDGTSNFPMQSEFNNWMGKTVKDLIIEFPSATNEPLADSYGLIDPKTGKQLKISSKGKGGGAPPSIASLDPTEEMRKNKNFKSAVRFIDIVKNSAGDLPRPTTVSQPFAVMNMLYEENPSLVPNKFHKYLPWSSSDIQQIIDSIKTGNSLPKRMHNLWSEFNFSKSRATDAGKLTYAVKHNTMETINNGALPGFQAAVLEILGLNFIQQNAIIRRGVMTFDTQWPAKLNAGITVESKSGATDPTKGSYSFKLHF